MMSARHGTYAANVIGSTGDKGSWIGEYKQRLTQVKKPWDGKCCFHDCNGTKGIVGGHLWIKGDISNEWYYIVPICTACNHCTKKSRAYDNWTKLKTGTKLLRINVKKSVSKLWTEQGYVCRRYNDKEAEMPIETDIDTEGIIDGDVQRQLDIAMAHSLNLSQSQLEDFVDNY